ncbi:MAG TPA: AMP-binding protein [Allocoleopsis sp.]
MKRISDGFIAQAQQQPNKAAIVLKTPGQGYLSRTYAEFLHNAQCIAATITDSLTAIDHPPLDPQPRSIALCLPNCLEFLDIFLGIILSGNTAMVLDPKWTEAQIQQTLQQHPPLLLFNHPNPPPVHYPRLPTPSISASPLAPLELPKA